MKSSVSQAPPASSVDAVGYFKRRLGFETDCWDVHESLVSGNVDFVLLDVRSPDLYRRSHIPGAINLPHAKIIKSKMAQWPADTLFVVYCAGPHCNGAGKAALRLAEIGRPVKELIGGMTGWADEGFAYFAGTAPGEISEVEQ